jgi:para-nitrobenzyl esterase
MTTQAGAPVVAAPAGTVRGARAGEVLVFRGIPYARPPVDALRWRPTEALPRWDGVREATRFGAACPQPASPFYTHATVSEDCLFLNVWAPAKADKAPVLFWIHGGSLVSGAGSDENYDGAAFAAKGVVVVTINYRLGALGWLAHPGLSGEAGTRTSGNYGLMDQVEALRWVRRNIAAFRGDPDNVTIAGESAGALSVLYLMADPEARGLFGRAIAESAYLITMPELRDGTFTDWPDAETSGVALAEKLGAHDVADLRAMSAEAIVGGTARTGYFPLGTVDGRLLPRQLIDVFDRGEQARVPILAGFNEGEIRSLRFLLPPAPVDAEAYEREIRARYGDLADAFLERYPAATLDESMLETTRDALYGWTAERLARSQTELGAPSFLYYFDHGYPAADQGGYRAFHASESP